MLLLKLPVGRWLRAFPVDAEGFVWAGACTIHGPAHGTKRHRGGYVVVQAPGESSVIVPAPVYETGANGYETGKAYVDVHTLNVRSGPGTAHPVTALVRKGDLLRIKGSENAWLYVNLPSGELGWVMGKFTRNTPPAKG